MKITTSLLDSYVEFVLSSNNQEVGTVLGSTISRGVEEGTLVLRDDSYNEIPLTHKVKNGDFVHICLR